MANGVQALLSNTTGSNNVADGLDALLNNTTGIQNTANGQGALYHNNTGNNNTANGDEALSSNTTGGNNIALGDFAGDNLTTGDNNIDIGNGDPVTFISTDSPGEANTIRIGRPAVQTATFIAGISGATVTGSPVIVDASGHLGTVPSSQRFKDQIKPMNNASEAILSLKPVTFRYKHDIDPKDIPQFGLVAEDVEKVNPDLVVRDANGKVYTVRYEAVNAMLLNEFLKEHKKVEELEATVTQLKVMAMQQQKEFTARLKEQDAKIQQVNDKVELSKPEPRTVNNNQ